MNQSSIDSLRLIFGRRSIRVFQPGKVSEETVRTLLEAAMAAPSAVAMDPWRFVVVRQRETLAKIVEGLPHGTMLNQAALGIFVCGDITVANDGQLSYLLQDCSAAIENLLLAAHALGLGACWLGIHPREKRMAHVRRILELPENIVPVAGIALGRPGETKDPRTRYQDAYVSYEKWGGALPGWTPEN
jgi:nitroreductase